MSKVNIGSPADFPPGQIHKVKAQGQTILVIHTDEGVCAIKNQCTHMPLPLANGKVTGNIITCPYHNSKFNVCTGENEDWVTGMLGIPTPKWSQGLLAMGKQPQGLQTYPITEENGELYVEI